MRAVRRGEPGRFRTPASMEDSTGMRTVRSASGIARHASRNPAVTSAGESRSVTPPCTSPDSIRTRHLPHTPSPPQEALMCTPASSAASMTDVPAGTSIVAPWGRKVTLTVGGGVALFI